MAEGLASSVIPRDPPRHAHLMRRAQNGAPVPKLSPHVQNYNFSGLRTRWVNNVGSSWRFRCWRPSFMHLMTTADELSWPASTSSSCWPSPRGASNRRHAGFFPSLTATRGRARARISRMVGRADPIGRLLCDFEVGLSPKNTHTAAQSKSVFKAKPSPV